MNRRWSESDLPGAAKQNPVATFTTGHTNQLEYKEQCALLQWCETQWLQFIDHESRHIEICLADIVVASLNGAHLHGDKKQRAIQWLRMKKAGAKKSEPDLSLNFAAKDFHGLKIEMKRNRRDFRSPSEMRRAIRPGQAEYIRLLNRLGYKAVFAYGWIDAAAQICQYLGWDAKAKGLI